MCIVLENDWELITAVPFCHHRYNNRYFVLLNNVSCTFFSQGQYKFKCPALKDGTLVKCCEVWAYSEVRRLAVLTADEMQYFEKKMATLAATEYCEYKQVSYHLNLFYDFFHTYE